MSSDKNMFVFTVNDSGYLLGIAVKAGTTYSQSDLTGNWAFYGLQSSDGANMWYRGQGTITSTGSNSFTTWLDSAGSTSIPSTTGMVFSITSSGIITDSANATTHGVMTADKNLFIMTQTSSGNSRLWIGVKR